MNDRTAIIILSYNMPEATDKLVEHILETVKFPRDLIVVDNGSDLVEPSKYSTFVIPENVQTTNGFLQGLEYADSLNTYTYYWLIISSAEFISEDKRDPLEVLLPIFDADPNAYCVQPSIIFDLIGEAWYRWLHPRKNNMFRREIWTDYISTIFRAEYFNSIGRFRKELTMMWGVPGECNWKARKNGWNIYIADHYSMYKHTNIGYRMDRMNMTAQERRELASAECDRVLIPIYGEDFRDRFGSEFYEDNRNS